MKYIVTLNGKKYEVEVEKGQATAVYAGPAEPVQPVQSAPASVPVQETKSQPVVAGEGTAIKSPMPGTILQVNVKNGDQVKAGDILFILEAMKMENEIVAPSDGQITSVSVNQGATVETDAVLATYK